MIKLELIVQKLDNNSKFGRKNIISGEETFLKWFFDDILNIKIDNKFHLLHTAAQKRV